MRRRRRRGGVRPPKAFADAGFTHLALVQIGGEHQGPFFDWAEKELLAALAALNHQPTIDERAATPARG